MLGRLLDVAGQRAERAVAAGEHVHGAPSGPLEYAVHHLQASDVRHVALQRGEGLQVRGELPSAGRVPVWWVVAVAPEEDAERGWDRFALGEGRAVTVAHGLENRQPERDTDAADRPL